MPVGQVRQDIKDPGFAKEPLTRILSRTEAELLETYPPEDVKHMLDTTLRRGADLKKAVNHIGTSPLLQDQTFWKHFDDARSEHDDTREALTTLTKHLDEEGTEMATRLRDMHRVLGDQGFEDFLLTIQRVRR